jgi:hypothetical protein
MRPIEEIVNWLRRPENLKTHRHCNKNVWMNGDVKPIDLKDKPFMKERAGPQNKPESCNKTY